MYSLSVLHCVIFVYLCTVFELHCTERSRRKKVVLFWKVIKKLKTDLFTNLNHNRMLHKAHEEKLSTEMQNLDKLCCHWGQNTGSYICELCLFCIVEIYRYIFAYFICVILYLYTKYTERSRWKKVALFCCQREQSDNETAEERIRRSCFSFVPWWGKWWMAVDTEKASSTFAN